MNGYIMDSNIYITSYRLNYPFDLFPSYWDKLITFADNHLINMNKHVFEEIAHESREEEKDNLQLWLENDFSAREFDITNDIVGVWQEVLQYIYHSPIYNQRAFDSWANTSVADPWIVATAKVHNLTVVTLETEETNLNSGSPTKKVKIPEVCKAFGVECGTLQKMLRDLSFRL